MAFASSQLQLTAAEKGKQIAELSLKLAYVQEAATRVSAPVAGIVDRVYVNVGQFLQPGTPVAKIVGKSKFQITAKVPAEIASRVDRNAPVVIRTKDQSNDFLSYHLTHTPTSGFLHELIVFVDDGLELKENQLVDVSLPVVAQNSQGEILVPADSLFLESNASYVYVIEDNKATKREITQNGLIGSMAIVTSGLSTGDQVILSRQVTQGRQLEVKE